MMNQRSLTFYFTRLFSTLSTFVTALLALNPSGPSTSTTSGEVCELTEFEIGTIQNLFAERSSSCIMNMTIASILN